MTTYDAIIIGTGQAGPSLAFRLAATGRKVAVLERKEFGGTCVNTGCIPTKAMVASAYAARLAARGLDFGVRMAAPPTVDMQLVKARKDAIVAHARDGLGAAFAANANITVYRVAGRFEAPRVIVAGSERLSAENIFINVGARAVIPPLPGLAGVPFLTNASMMSVDFLPRHLLILGGSYVGLEFAQMFRRFGSEVSIVELGPRLIGREDEDVSAAVLDILNREGITCHLRTRCDRVVRAGKTVRMELEGPEGRSTLDGTHLLLAVGRRPNTDDLGLEAAGIAADRGIIAVDDQLRTNVPGVWALGECNGHGAFTHTSYNDFEIVAANLLEQGSRRISDRITTYGLFIDPPLGRAGMTEAEARLWAAAHGGQLAVGKRPMTRVARAIEKGETQGLMKIVVDRASGRLLGAAVLGPGGDEAVHCVLDLMYAGAKFEVLQRAVHIHPTVAELLPTILGELQPLPAPS